MNSQEILSQSSSQEHFHFGHIATIAGTIALLLFFTFVKNPQIFSSHKNQNVSSGNSNVPKYYAYAPSPEDAKPMVAGATTEAQGPSVINEDGSITPVSETGEVLGVSTDQMNLSLDSIVVANQISDSDAAIKKYLDDSDALEASSINNTDFETALSSGDQIKINAQVEKMKSIVAQLQKMPVPRSATTLHKNKILQYDAAITILQNYTKADENAELVSQALGVFLQVQDNISQEITKIQISFHLTDAVTQ